MLHADRVQRGLPVFQHSGTEPYMLEGVMVYVHGDARYEMKPDALIFDGRARTARRR
ncbi:hypothetical protein HBB16_08930 [Pseudonocardia sp. MCCB 268]|nr:hypothetical protein [Pseudonocardia cytotoxica]